MPFIIFKDNKEIQRFGRVTVGYVGALECRDEFGGRVRLILAAGQWDSVRYEKAESART